MVSPSINFRNTKIYGKFQDLLQQKFNLVFKWIWNSAYIISMLLHDNFLHEKISFNNLIFILLVTLGDSLTYNTLSLLKSVFSLLFIPQGSQIKKNFKQNKNAIYDFLWEFNSFWVIFKIPFKMKVFFRGGAKNWFSWI